MFTLIDKYQLSIKINNEPEELINGTTGGLSVTFITLSDDKGVCNEHWLYLTKEELDELYKGLKIYYNNKEKGE